MPGHCVEHSFYARGDAELGKDTVEVSLHGTNTDAQLVGNNLISKTVRRQLQNLTLTRTELLR